METFFYLIFEIFMSDSIGPIRNGNSYPRYCPLLPKIQSDRYGMETHTLDIVHCYQRFNRTDTEWKLEFLDKMDNPLPRFNRTDTEWKRALQSCNVRSLRIQSDRYGMETNNITPFKLYQDSIGPIRNGNKESVL